MTAYGRWEEPRPARFDAEVAASLVASFAPGRTARYDTKRILSGTGVLL